MRFLFPSCRENRHLLEVQPDAARCRSRRLVSSLQDESESPARYSCKRRTRRFSRGVCGLQRHRRWSWSRFLSPIRRPSNADKFPSIQASTRLKATRPRKMAMACVLEDLPQIIQRGAAALTRPASRWGRCLESIQLRLIPVERRPGAGYGHEAGARTAQRQIVGAIEEEHGRRLHGGECLLQGGAFQQSGDVEN